jgi:hypothetical protein
MFTTHSYQEVLSERASGHNFVISAWFVLLAVTVFMLAVA